MTSKKTAIAALCAAAVGLILIVTNPSQADFSARMNAKEGFFSQFTCKGVETGNYVLFSRYEYRCVTKSEKYVGVLGNYIELGGKKDDGQS